jgi:hypothetical protein
MNTPDIRKRLTRRLAQMDTDREKWRAHWKDIQTYLLPDNGIGLSGASNATEQTDGGKKHSSIIDNSAGWAMNVLAAGMQSGLTSPTRPWFKLGIAERDLMEFQTVKIWLGQVEEAIRYVFNRGNAYRALHHSYKELAGFGTGPIYVAEDFDTGIHCRPFTGGEYWLGVDHNLRVNAFYRSFWFTAAQMVGEFGEENVSDPVKLALRNDSTALFEVVQAIEPNDDRLDEDVAGSKPIRSVYFERSGTGEKLLKVGGYNEFPVMAPRWDAIGGRIYGSCPGMEYLADIKMLQKIREKQLINLDKAMEPPLKAPASLKNDVVNTMPGGITYADEINSRDGFGALYQVPIVLKEADEMANGVAARIQRGFFVDLFLMLANLDKRNMTATEVAERHEEKLLMLGPVLERLNSELLDPLISRTFSILLRTGPLPPPPPEVQGRELHVEYISVLAQAQKAVSVTGIQQVAGFVGSVAAVQPEALDMLDTDEAIRIYADSIGVSPRLIRDPRMVQMLRQQRQQQQQAMQQAALAQQAAEGAKTLSETKVGENSALDMMLGRPQA